MARMKAPAGGAITNNVFHPGGQFLPRALGRIRDVIARKTKLARPANATAFGESVKREIIEADTEGASHHRLPVHDAIQDFLDDHGDPRADLVRNRHPEGSLKADEDAWAASGAGHDARFVSGVVGQHKFDDGTHLTVLRHVGPNGGHWHVQWNPVPGASSFHGSYGVHMTDDDFKSWLAKFDPDVRAAMVASFTASARTGQRPFKLASKAEPKNVTLGAALDSAGVPSGPVTRSLTPAELRSVENYYQLPDKHLLSPHVKVGPDGTINTTISQVAKFKDAIHQSLVPGNRALRRVLTGPYSDAVKHAHIVLNLGEDAKRAKKNVDGEWYNDKIREADELTKKYLGHDQPTHELYKALLAFTSGAQDPEANTATAIKMLRSGQRAAPKGEDPFLHISPVQTEALANWRAENPHIPDPPKDYTGLTRWVHKYGINKANIPYKAREVQYVNRPDHPDHGLALRYQASETTEDDDRPKKRWNPVGTEEEVNRKYLEHKGHVKTMFVPLLDEHGKLQPKNWSVRGKAVVDALDRFKRIIRHVGGDHAAAVKWLTDEHPLSEIESVTGSKPSTGYYPAGTKSVPGAFTFGPKFGPFFLNLLIPDRPELAKHLTADMWWARNWQRYLGRIYGKKGKIVGGPANDVERRAMWKAAQEVAQKHNMTVAALQAALWYHEQGGWRLFGAKNKSVDYADGIRKAMASKLSRADVRPLQSGIRNRPLGETDHGMLADFLAEHGDPRETLVRTHNYSAMIDASRAAGNRELTAPTAIHTFPDDTKLEYVRYHGDGGTHHYLAWNAATTRPSDEYGNVIYQKHFPDAELRDWLAKFPDDETERMYKSLKLEQPKS